MSDADDLDDLAKRMEALKHDAAAAHHRMRAAMIRLDIAAQRFNRAMRTGEIRDVQQHPDLAELDLQLDGFYGDTASGAGAEGNEQG